MSFFVRARAMLDTLRNDEDFARAENDVPISQADRQASSQNMSSWRPSLASKKPKVAQTGADADSFDDER